MFPNAFDQFMDHGSFACKVRRQIIALMSSALKPNLLIAFQTHIYPYGLVACSICPKFELSK